jgi:hypothetical protein
MHDIAWYCVMTSVPDAPSLSPNILRESYRRVQLAWVCSLVVQEAGGEFVGGEALVFGEESGVEVRAWVLVLVDGGPVLVGCMGHVAGWGGRIVVLEGCHGFGGFVEVAAIQ